MTKDELMDLVNRSLFASNGYTDEEGRQNIRRVLKTRITVFRNSRLKADGFTASTEKAA